MIFVNVGTSFSEKSNIDTHTYPIYSYCNRQSIIISNSNVD